MGPAVALRCLMPVLAITLGGLQTAPTRAQELAGRVFKVPHAPEGTVCGWSSASELAVYNDSTWYAFSVASGRLRPLTNMSIKGRTPDLSPDGRRCCWQSFDESRLWTVADLHTGRRMEWMPDWASNVVWDQVVWTCDSRRWLHITVRHAGTEAQEFDAETGRSVDSWRLAGVRFEGEFIGMTRTGQLLLYANPRALGGLDETNATIVAIHTQRERGHIQLYTLRLPDGIDQERVSRVVCSPKGDRLAWLILLPEASPAPLPPLHTDSADKQRLRSAYASVWISRVDGRDLHRIAVMPFEDAPGSCWPRDRLLWSPDGRRLAFVSYGGIEIISAPPP